jgi:hypothetical protein
VLVLVTKEKRASYLLREQCCLAEKEFVLAIAKRQLQDKVIE